MAPIPARPPFPAPAHMTKSEPMLSYPVPQLSLPLELHQSSSSGTTTGSTLWTASQVLTAFLPTVVGAAGGRALELGAGVGLTALALAAAGWDVTATDVGDALPLLRRNVAANAERVRGTVHVRELDWCAPAPPPPSPHEPAPHWDLVVTADTVYAADLVPPLMRTIAAARTAKTAVYMAVELRDVALVDVAHAEAARVGLALRKLPRTRVRKAVRAALAWDEPLWAGVEIWKLVCV